jgi:hypothetical protein
MLLTSSIFPFFMGLTNMIILFFSPNWFKKLDSKMNITITILINILFSVGSSIGPRHAPIHCLSDSVWQREKPGCFETLSSNWIYYDSYEWSKPPVTLLKTNTQFSLKISSAAGTNKIHVINNTLFDQVYVLENLEEPFSWLHATIQKNRVNEVNARKVRFYLRT